MSHGIVTHAPTLADDVARWARPTSPPQVAPVGRYEVTGTRDRQGVRRRLRLDDDTFVFLALGCMRADKRIPFLLQAFEAVTAPDVRLVVAGALLDADAAAALAAVRDPRVRWIGRVLDVDEVADLHAASDAAVLARAEDWTPSSMLHAQDHGLPVVAADLPSHRETLGSSWARFTAGSPTSLASAMQDLASDPKRASAMGAAGRRGRGDWHASAAATAAAFGLHEPAPTAHRRGALITTGR
jgi:glycosyltransferase involved in cell wall biosynthesis